MISYNPKDLFKFLFTFYRGDTFRKLFPFLLFIGLYSWLVEYLVRDYYHLPDNSFLKNISMMHTLLGFAISMLLVFRTNTAYDRWWEGRKQWGTLVNNSRNLAIKLNSMLPADDEKNRSFFSKLIPRFAWELKHHLHQEETRYQLDDHPHPEIPNFDRNKHLPIQVAGLLMSRIDLLYRQKLISGEQLMLLNPEIMSLLDVTGACERIKNTPIPYSYSGFLKRFIFIYVITMPLGLVFNLGYLMIPVVIIIFYVLASLEVIAEEIEDPFGKDTNDLPMHRMCENIQKNIMEILH
jgi:putative membrane protein